MGSKNVMFTYNDLEKLTIPQLVKRFVIELNRGTYDNKNIDQRHLDTCKSILQFFYNNGVITPKQRRSMILFQFNNDPHSKDTRYEEG